MKRPLSIFLAAAMLLISMPGSIHAVDDDFVDPADQIETPDELPDPAEVQRIVREFLRDELHFNEAVTCGILANIYTECRFKPSDRYLESGGFTSYGLCQWNRTRLQGLLDYCEANGYEPHDVMGQLGYIKYELETKEKKTYQMIRSISNDAEGAYEAGYNWARYYERCNEGSYAKRANLAKDTFWPTYGKYLPVGLNVPYYPAEGGDSLSACYTMTEAYLAGYPAGDSRVTEGLTEIDPAKLYTERDADPETILEALHTGIPVILLTKAGRAGLIYGYDGNSEEADPAGLRLLVPTQSKQLMPGSYQKLTEDLSECSVLIRKDLTASLPICTDGVSELTLDAFAHPINLTAGGTVALGGRLTSTVSITRVTLTLTDADGGVAASTSAKPNEAFFDLARLPALSKTNTLPNGDYTLTLTAEDASGSILEYTDPLAISELPLSVRIGECGVDPTVIENETIPGIYRITAQSGLRLRSEPSLDGEILTTMRHGTVVTVTEVTEDGWGKTTYSGKTGWMSMEYAEFVSSVGFIVSYHGNGGSGIPSSMIKKEGVGLVLPDTIPERVGYRFLGWSENRLATDAEYLPGDYYTGDDHVTLYAVWQEIFPVYGDITGEGTVNMRDIVLLQQYLNGYDVPIDFAASDLDGDGLISMRDIALLQRYLNEV